MGLCRTLPPILQFGRELMVSRINIQRSPHRSNIARQFMSVVSASEAALACFARHTGERSRRATSLFNVLSLNEDLTTMPRFSARTGASYVT
jgi:hypothetical protein